MCFATEATVSEGRDTSFAVFSRRVGFRIFSTIFFMAMLAILTLVAQSPASAWEFSMNGEYEYRFRYFSRTGDNDLFGKASLQDGPIPPNPVWPSSSPVGFAGPNIYHGGAEPSVMGYNATTSQMKITRGGFSEWGCDALFNEQRLTVRPSVTVFKAMRISAMFSVGGIRHNYAQRPYPFFLFPTVPGGPVDPSPGTPPFERYLQLSSSDNAYDTMAIPSVEQLRCNIKVPWCTFSVGMKSFPWGLGLSMSRAYRGTSLLTVVPSGPFRFLWACWLARGYNRGGQHYDSPYDSRPPGHEKRDFFQGYFVTYGNGPVSLGAGSIHFRQHIPRKGHGFNRDESLDLYTAFLKYFDGRFFANAQYEWIDFGDRRLGAEPLFQELYHAAAEAGLVIGPARVSLVWAQASGPVRHFQPPEEPLVFNSTKVYAPWPIGYEFMAPYEWLMFNIYGGGNQCFGGLWSSSDGHGMMSDAYAFAARIDYSLASNLNLWCSYIWAHRLETNGTLFGQYTNWGGDTTAELFAPLFGPGEGYRDPVLTAYGRTPPAGNPFVTDGFIGWEVGFGIDWKLLEGLTFGARYAYWQPGEYFEQAWQAIGVRGGAVVNNAMFLSRDAIHGFQGNFVVTF